MKFTIKHEKKGRIRVHLFQKYMNYNQADTLQYYLENLSGVKKAQVFNRTCDALIYYTGDRNELLKSIQAFGYTRVSVPVQVLENSGRALNETYKEKLVDKILFHYGRKLLLPYPWSAIYTTAMSVKYIWLGIKTLWKRKIEVPVLDATAIGVSIFRGDFSTAGSVMFLLGIGELLEEWTHKKSVDDLARTMSLNTGKVWLRSGEFAAVEILAQISRSFKEKYPLVQIALHTGTADTILEMMNKGLVDIGLFLEPVSTENLEYIRIPDSDQWGVGMRPDDPLARKEFVTKQDLLNRPLILPERLGIQSELANWFGKDFEKLNISFTSNLGTNAGVMAMYGLAYPVSIQGAAKYWREDLLAQRRLYPEIKSSTVIAWRRNIPYSRAIQLFIEEINAF